MRRGILIAYLSLGLLVCGAWQQSGLPIMGSTGAASGGGGTFTLSHATTGQSNDAGGDLTCVSAVCTLTVPSTTAGQWWNHPDERTDWQRQYDQLHQRRLYLVDCGCQCARYQRSNFRSQWRLLSFNARERYISCRHLLQRNCRHGTSHTIGSELVGVVYFQRYRRDSQQGLGCNYCRRHANLGRDRFCSTAGRTRWRHNQFGFGSL